GFQHLSAMTRDEKTAKLVNLTPQEVRQDIYETVADRVRQRVKGDIEYYEITDLAYMWLKEGVDRKVVKRNVMTYVYGSNSRGMAGQHREDLMRPLADKVKRGKLNEHPFGEDEGAAAAEYIAQVIHSIIEKVATRPAAAMKFLQLLAAA